MKSQIIWKASLFFLTVFSAVFDVLTSKNLFILESNPLILLGGGFALFVLIKIFIVALMTYQFWNIDKYKQGIQFLLCTGMVLLIVMQAYAGVNNLIVAKEVQGQDLPAKLSMSQKLNQVQSYLAFSLIFFYYPMMISLFSFVVYNKCRTEPARRKIR